MLTCYFRRIKDRVPHEADFVCYFFEQARTRIASNQVRRVGLIATSSIRAGASRRVLENIKASGDIFMAWSDLPWTLEGAAVRIAIVAFDNGDETTRIRDGQPVLAINPDLTSSLDMTGAPSLRENAGIAFMGDTKGGPFEIPGTLARQWLTMPLNPNGRPNSDVIRPWANGLEITGRPRDLYIIDFGTEMTEVDAALYELPFEHVRQHVKPMRDTNNRESYRQRWWLHVEPRSGMRTALKGLGRYVATPRVASHRLFVWLDGATLADSRVFVFARGDDYFYGILQSHIHSAWSLKMGSWHGGERPTYVATTCFETFPFPWPPGKEPQDDPRVAAIAAAARRLVELRDNWLNPSGADAATLKARTLTNLYNQRPTWLDNAHRALDRAVLAAYGWPDGLADDDLLARLLALNGERAGGNVAGS